MLVTRKAVLTRKRGTTSNTRTNLPLGKRVSVHLVVASGARAVIVASPVARAGVQTNLQATRMHVINKGGHAIRKLLLVRLQLTVGCAVVRSPAILWHDHGHRMKGM